MRLGLLIVVLAMASCGGDEGGADDGPGGTENTTPNAASNSGPAFSVSDLPDGFPVDLVPPSFDAGEYTELLGFPTANFESSLSFDEAVDHYSDVYGEGGVVVAGDPGERLAQWTQKPPWIVTVIEGDPLTIGIVNPTGE